VCPTRSGQFPIPSHQGNPPGIAGTFTNPVDFSTGRDFAEGTDRQGVPPASGAAGHLPDPMVLIAAAAPERPARCFKVRVHQLDAAQRGRLLGHRLSSPVRVFVIVIGPMVVIAPPTVGLGGLP
jgi:hypothetical protein